MEADYILQSNFIFDGISNNPYKGSIAIKDNKIISINSSFQFDLAGQDTIIYSLDDKLITPGFVDTHCFFAGHLLEHSGFDLKNCHSLDELYKIIDNHIKNSPTPSLFLGRELSPKLCQLEKQHLDKRFPNMPVIIKYKNTNQRLMNQKSIDTFHFTPNTFSPENASLLLKTLIQDPSVCVPALQEYLKMLNSKGITSIKEMFFDDAWTFTDTVEDLAQKGELNMRLYFMSQPVNNSLNLQLGQDMKRKLKTDFFIFSGYNLMTDGSISDMEAEMKIPYHNSKINCKLNINWDSIERDVLAADNQGFRFSLHAQGDSAIKKSISIFNKCRKDIHGKLKNKHAITDLEYTDPKDLDLMGKLGIIAEIYPQIMSLASRSEKVSTINKMVGTERSKNYWNRRKLAENNIVISCATDLPLLYPDIPESIYHSVGGFFNDSDRPFNHKNTLQIHELLKAWTIGGQYNLGNEHILGTLEKGKIADIAVIDNPLFNLPIENVKTAKVCLTILNGKIVYSSL